MSPTNANFFGRYLTSRHFVTACISLVVVILIFGAVMMLPSRATEQNIESARPVPVKVVAAQKLENYQIDRRYTGQIKAARHSQLAFQLGGEVKELYVDFGDRVNRGQPLAKLDQRHLLAKQAASQAELQQAEAILDELDAGPRAQTIAAAAAEVEDLEAQLKNASNDVRRRESLVETTAVTFEEYEEALFQMKALTARREVAAQKLAELRAGTRKERIAAQKGRVLQAKAKLADIEHDLEDTILKAPYDGQVSARHLDDGAVVEAGMVAFEITEVGVLEFWVGLPPDVAQRIEANRVYNLSMDGSTLKAKLKSKAPNVSRTTHTRTTLFTLNDAKNIELVDGQVGRIDLPQMVEKSGYWVPTTALVPQSRGLWSAYVAEGEESDYVAASRYVEVLATEGDRSFVRGTITEGERVIVEGVHRIVEGQKVDPVSTQTEGQAPSKFADDEVLQ